MCVSTSVDTLPKVSGGQEAHEGGYILGFALYATHPFLEDPVMGAGIIGNHGSFPPVWRGIMEALALV